jgi:uncharacterized protein YbjT (DUF2867 family)
VREVSRHHGIHLQDQRALNEAFAKADTAYLMVPFDVTAPDLHRFEDMVADSLIAAINHAGIERVVLLSGLSAYLKTGTSLGAARMESRLDELQIPQLVHLRAAFFNENFTAGMSFAAQAKSGVFATPFRGDLPMPFVAAADVGVHVANLLGAENWPDDRIMELHGGGSLTFAEVTEILGEVLGLKVVYETIAYEAAYRSLLAGGMSPSFADALLETAASFNRGDRWALEAPSPHNTTPTTFRQWAEQSLIAEAAA